jgi:hypothetical protein
MGTELGMLKVEKSTTTGIKVYNKNKIKFYWARGKGERGLSNKYFWISGKVKSVYTIFIYLFFLKM